MHYRLGNLNLHPVAATAHLAQARGRDGGDLLQLLSARRKSTADFQVEADGLQMGVVSGGGLTLRWRGSGGDLPVTGRAAEELRLLSGKSKRDFSYLLHESPTSLRVKLESALHERGAGAGGFTLRTQNRQVCAILPPGFKPLDNLEAAQASYDESRAWCSKGVEVHIDCCQEHCGDLLLTACAPSMAAEVNPGDWLYAGIALSNSESTVDALEVRPRIYRVFCANGAIAQEAEGEGFVIEKVPRQGIWAKVGAVFGSATQFREKLAKSFELAFRPERVGHAADVGRHAANAVIVNPYEHLAHLVAAGLLSGEERDLARRLFEEQGDHSLYGLSNAITAAAHSRRGGSDLRRSLGLEQLGGEVARGDHGPPVGAPVYY